MQYLSIKLCQIFCYVLFLSTTLFANAHPKFPNFINVGSGKYLVSNIASHVFALNPNGRKDQLWVVTPHFTPGTANYLYSTIVNYATGFNLKSNAQGFVYSHLASGGDHQKWVLEIYNSMFHYVTLKNLATGLYLTCDSYGNISTSARNRYSSSQLWVGITNY